MLNAWSRSDRAIVTDLPGTTRDVVESQLIVGGIPVQVLDTAGIRESVDEVEKIGIARSQAAAQAADLVLLTVDAILGWGYAEQMLYEQIKDKPHILVINKIDLLDRKKMRALNSANPLPGNHLPDAATVYTAAAQNQGIEALEKAILNAVRSGNLAAADTDIAINQRQAAALVRAEGAIAQVQLHHSRRATARLLDN